MADFSSTASGARPLGMGGAFVALADDANAIAYNPAGLALIRRAEFAADYGRPVAGLADTSALTAGFAAWIQPVHVRKNLAGRVKEVQALEGAGGQNIDPDALMKSLEFEKTVGTLGFGFSNLTLSGAVSENIFSGSFARNLAPRWWGGFSLKGLYETYSQDLYTAADPVFSGPGKSQVLKLSMDAGLLYNLYPRVFWGLSVTDFNRPDSASNALDHELLQPGLRSGFAFRERSFKAAADWSLKDGSNRIQVGAEQWFHENLLAARAGADLSVKGGHAFSLGASLRWGNVQVDYAFLYPVSAFRDSLGSHKVSFAYRFGKVPADETEPGSIEHYYSQLELEAEILKTRLEKAVGEEALLRIGRGEPEQKNLTVSTAAPEGMQVYVTMKGDTLESLAQFFYGSRNRWPDLYQANRDRVGKAGRLKPGTVLFVPEKREPPPEEQPKILAPIPNPAPKINREAPKRKEVKEKPEPAGPKIYVVQEGDSLQTIAEKMYGNPKRWKEIYQANTDKVERGWVEPGQVLLIP